MEPSPNAKFKAGDRVLFLRSDSLKGRIVELRGPLGPNRAEIYRIMLRRKPKPTYIEVREDQIYLDPKFFKPVGVR